MPNINPPQNPEDEQELFSRLFMFRNNKATQEKIKNLTPFQRAKYHRWSKGAKKALLKWRERLECDSENQLDKSHLT